MTEIQICNLALGALGTAGITSFDDDSDEARACKAFYGPMRDAVLEDAIWSFAKRQYTLTPDATAPDFAWAYRFTLPSTVAKVWRVSDNTDEDDAGIPWERQGAYLMADSSPVYVTAVQRLTDTSLYPAAFCLALAARIASELAIPLTENKALQADQWQLYQKKLTDAHGLDKSQGTHRGVRQRDIDPNALKWVR